MVMKYLAFPKEIFSLLFWIFVFLSANINVRHKRNTPGFPEAQQNRQLYSYSLEK
jgi:hypothetical protein